MLKEDRNFIIFIAIAFVFGIASTFEGFATHSDDRIVYIGLGFFMLGSALFLTFITLRKFRRDSRL